MKENNQNMNKQELVAKHLSKPIEVGDTVWVRGLGSQNKAAFHRTSVVTKIQNGLYWMEADPTKGFDIQDLKPYLENIGVNPFPKVRDTVRTINFQLHSILHSLGIKGDRSEYKTKSGIIIAPCNWNPFVINKNGEREYYQRDFVWSQDDNQNLIDSIYQGIDCGKILIRDRSWQEVELMGEDAAWKDIVDGKQRLNAIRLFISNEFPDSDGHYWNDLSDVAQRRFMDHQLFSYAELPENSKDEDVIEQFLRLNFCGVPQSKDHIEFVKSLRL